MPRMYRKQSSRSISASTRSRWFAVKIVQAPPYELGGICAEKIHIP